MQPLEKNNFIHTDKKLVVKYFIAERPKVIGKKDRKGKVTYIPQPQLFRKPKLSLFS